jgi:hypothetical protein
MKTIILSIVAAGAAAVAVVAPDFERQKGKGNSKDKSKESYMDSSKESSKETRKTTAGTYWSEDTRPMPVPEPSSPVVILALAGAAVLMRRSA